MGQLRTRKRGSTWRTGFENRNPVNGKRKSISGRIRTKPEALAAGNYRNFNEYNSIRPDLYSHWSVSPIIWITGLVNYCKMNLEIQNAAWLSLHCGATGLKPALRTVPALEITDHRFVIQEYVEPVKMTA